MAHFLKGTFKGFYAAGPSRCVKDTFRFRKVGENKVMMEVTRRDQESLVGKFWKWENSTMTLIPLDEAEPRLGGKVQVKSWGMDFRTFTPSMQTQYGIYNDEFVTYGTFTTEAGNPLDDEEVLLNVMDDASSVVADKTTFRFENNELHFGREINEDLTDAEVNHAIKSTQLDTVQRESWTETLFYGVGNKSM